MPTLNLQDLVGLIQAWALPVLGVWCLLQAAAIVLIRSTVTMNLREPLVAVAEEDLPPEDRFHFSALAETLRPEGYLDGGTYRVAIVPNVETVSLWCHGPDGHTGAMFNRMRRDDGVTVDTAEFATGFTDGHELIATDCVDAGTVDGNPGKRTWIFPETAGDPVTLLRIHAALLAEALADGKRPDPLPLNRSFECFMKGEMKRELDQKVERGWWKRDGEVYGLTWKGATLMTLAQLPPWKPLLNRRKVSRGRAKRRELGV